MRPQTQVTDLVEAIRPILAGHQPDIQGAVLAELTAIWLTGHPPQIRPEMFALQVKAVISLTNHYDNLMFGPEGHPSVSRNN